jgi:Zn-dependent protease with chaperone function
MTKLAAAFSLGLALAACTSTTDQGATGISRKQFLLVSSSEVEAAALQAYKGELGKAAQAGKLNTDKANLERIRIIADRLIPHVATFRPDALQWQWEVNLETNDQLNAYCAPGGKIMFFTGIINKLNLSDDEIAAIMGHEMAHALREHGRERMSQAVAQNLGIALGSKALGIDEKKAQIANMGATVLFALPNSRGQEAEADIVGLELMARAGYNPQGAVSLWQKMGQAGGGGGIPWLSTHPSGPQRIEGIQSRIPQVMPLYNQARAGAGKTPPRVVPRT